MRVCVCVCVRVCGVPKVAGARLSPLCLYELKSVMQDDARLRDNKAVRKQSFKVTLGKQGRKGGRGPGEKRWEEGRGKEGKKKGKKERTSLDE